MLRPVIAGLIDVPPPNDAGPPSGSASGDLGGTYPGPSVLKVNGVAFPASPGTGLLPLVTGANQITYSSVDTILGLSSNGLVKRVGSNTYSVASTTTDYQPVRWFDVKSFGAVGDGTTDDTTPISNAIAAITSTGGVLYFPVGTYKVTSGFTLSKPITILGDGGFGNSSTSTLGRSAISFSTTSGTLFTITANGCEFKEIHLHNPSGTTPTGGAGISVTSNGQSTRYQSISVSGFYINIDHRTGELSTWENCFLTNPVLYDLKLQNTNTFDGGDWSIKGCNFNTSRAAAAAIRLESGGGLKITNTKINANIGANSWTNGIDVHLGASAVSGDLLISNCSIEGYGGAGSGIALTTTDGTSFYRHVLINNVQFGAFGTANSGSAVSISGSVADQFTQIVVSGCSAFASPTSTGTAYIFNNVNTVRFDPSNIASGYSKLVSYSNIGGTAYSEFRNPQVADGAMAYGLSVANPTTAYNASPLSGVGLGTVYNSAGNTAGMGGIAIAKQNTTDGDFGSTISLYTRATSQSVTENFRLIPDSSTFTDGAIKYTALLFNQAVYSSTPLSGLYFVNKFNSSGSSAGMGGIAVGKNNNVDGDTAGFVAFYTRANGSNTAEVARFFPTGGLSVGSTTDSGAGNLLLNGLTASSFIESDANKVLVSKTKEQMKVDLATVTNDNATAGGIGESVKASVVQGSAVALTTATPKTVTSIPLTAGDWDITGIGAITGASTGTEFDVAIGTTTNSMTGTVLGDTRCQTPTVSLAGADATLMVPSVRVSISSTTTYYLIVQETFTVGSPAAYGRISARRVR